MSGAFNNKLRNNLFLPQGPYEKHRQDRLGERVGLCSFLLRAGLVRGDFGGFSSANSSWRVVPSNRACENPASVPADSKTSGGQFCCWDTVSRFELTGGSEEAQGSPQDWGGRLYTSRLAMDRRLELNEGSDYGSPKPMAVNGRSHTPDEIGEVDQPSLPGSCDFLENQAEAAMHASRMEVRRMMAPYNGEAMEISWPPPVFGKKHSVGNMAEVDENPHLRPATSQNGSASSSDPPANPHAPQAPDVILPVASSGPPDAHDQELLKVRARWTSAMWYAAQEAQRRRDRLLRRLSFRNGPQGPTERRRGPAAILKAVANSKSMTAATYMSTLWVLYGMDIYFLTDPPISWDKSLYGITFVCFSVLSMDLTLNTWFHAQYFNSFYFWLDLVAIMSVIPDVMWLFSQANNSWTTQVGFLAVARAARAARASTSASRVIRSVPKLKKFFLKRKNTISPDVERQRLAALRSVRRRRSGSVSISGQALIDIQEPDQEYELHSKIGRDLDAIVSTHMIMVVGVQFLISILLSFLFTYTRTNDIKTQVRMLSISNLDCVTRPCASFDRQLDVFRYNHGNSSTPLLFLSLAGKTLAGDSEAILALRTYPQEFIEMNFTVDGGYAVLHLENKTAFRNSIIDNILTITTVIGVLVAASMSLATSIRLEAVVPMERMISTIQELAVNPLKPLKTMKNAASNNETSMVEQALIKFGSLLQLGFGEAGAKIITGQMINGRVDATLPGKVTQAIFGFCDIRNFTDCTEVLQGDVVKLVNGIAHYVHTAVKDNLGAPNKNIGDAFLLVWKPKGQFPLSYVATSALRSYVRTIIAISQDANLSRLARNPRLQERLPGFKVKMGFGLHYGWAIEGAIGSAQKIDASYLSPHVNIASRLEACTKQYGVAILISQHLHALLDSAVKPLCRLVDRVTLKGSNVPMLLYTYDVPPVSEDGSEARWWVDGVHACDRFMNVTTFFFRAAPPDISEEFRDVWDMAMNLYLGGPGGLLANWSQCAQLLKKCLKLRPDDGPSQTLLDVIKSEGDEYGHAPASWQGYRKLMEK